MKILVVQLARFGDIYQTWPVLRALRRQNPTANIQLLVRGRFADATEGLSAVDRIIELPTSDWLSTDIDGALEKIERWLTDNDLGAFDRVINLSFSPLSSYLVDLIGCAEVSGYTRQTDGYLAIPDEPSAYFYAQVGLDRSNRIHLDDLFAMVAGVELCDDDFRSPVRDQVQARSGLVIQIGASQSHKTFGREGWIAIIQALLDRSTETLTLIGAAGEWSDEWVVHPRLINRVGQTRLFELFDIIGSARIFIGCDSVGQHIAALTQTPTLNLSFASLRFWETGPRAAGSRILWFEEPDACDVGRVCGEALRMLGDGSPGQPIIEKVERSGVIYDLVGYDEDSFSWELVRALYAHSDKSCSVAELCQRAHLGSERVNITRLAFERTFELADLALQQIAAIEASPNAMAIQILDQVDSLLEQVSRLASEISPLIRWFQAEKIRIAPGALNDILMATRRHFVELRDIAHAATLNLQFGRETAANGFTEA